MNLNLIRPMSLLASFHKLSEHVTTTTDSNPALLLMAPHTCELLHGLQPHADGLVGEQRRGGQRARHALHDANVLHALGHGERGRSVVRFKGTVAVYAAACRIGGGKTKQREMFLWYYGILTHCSNEFN